MAVSGPTPTSANLQSGCTFDAGMLAAALATSGSAVVGSVDLRGTGVAAMRDLLSTVADGELLRGGASCV